MDEVKRYINTLMETAIRIQGIFDYLLYKGELSLDKIGDIDWFEQANLVRGWAYEYEETYKDTDDYENNFLDHSQKFAERKIKEKFGKE